MTATSAQQKTVATPSAEYTGAAALWALPRALMGGTRAMRAAGRAYLPKEDGESDPNYLSRLNRSTLFNGFRKTVKDMTGKVFARPIALGDDLPEKLKGYAENIDLAGRNLNVFAYDVFADALQAGISFILTEMPPVQPNATREDDIRSGRRPYLVHIRAEELIGWKSDLVAGQETLTQVRIAECVTEPDPDNPFEEREVRQIRVIERGAWSVYRQASDEPTKWTLFDEGPNSLTDIALAPVYLNRTGFMLGAPPLEDLADLNVSHWQSQSDQRNILHVARVPILFGSGFEATATLAIGAGTMARSTNPAAKLQFVEHSGAAIGAGRDDLKDLELQMQAMGLQLLMPKPGQTATGEIRDDVKENSPLAMMAKALEDALEQSFGFMAAYIGLGQDAGGSLDVNTDFGIAAHTTADLPVLLQAAEKRMIGPDTFIKELKRRLVLADELDPEKEAEICAALKKADAMLALEIAQTATPAAPLLAAAA